MLIGTLMMATLCANPGFHKSKRVSLRRSYLFQATMITVPISGVRVACVRAYYLVRCSCRVSFAWILYSLKNASCGSQETPHVIPGTWPLAQRVRSFRSESLPPSTFHGRLLCERGFPAGPKKISSLISTLAADCQPGQGCYSSVVHPCEGSSPLHGCSAGVSYLSTTLSCPDSGCSLPCVVDSFPGLSLSIFHTQ